MNPVPMTLIANFGHDPSLLTASDAFLRHRQNVLSDKIEMLAAELDGIMKAQRIKRTMADKNMVAVNVDQNGADSPAVKLLPLQDAICQLSADDAEAERQLRTWLADGYDVGEALPSEEKDV